MRRVTLLSSACVLAALVTALGGCAARTVPVSPAVVVVEPVLEVDYTGWRAVATPGDIARLSRIDPVWTAALAEARVTHRRAVVAEGALLDPAGALPRVAISPGRYRCRVIALGRNPGTVGPRFAVFKPQTCFVQVENELLVLMKATGSSLPGGRLWSDGDARMIFLGSTAPRPGAAAPGYGGDLAKDRAGILERVGDFRWRLITPMTGRGPRLEVMELIPETAQS